MKKIKLLVIMLLMFLFVGILNVNAITNRNVYLLVEDSFSDGWDGSVVSIFGRSTIGEIGRYGLDSGGAHLYTISIPIGELIEVFFEGMGGSSECSFKLGYDPTFADSTKLIIEKPSRSLYPGTTTILPDELGYRILGESFSITYNTPTGGTYLIDSEATNGSTITISNIVPDTGYQLKEIRILKASDDTDVTTSVNYDAATKTFIMPDYAVKVNVVFEKINYTLTITGDNVTINPASPIDVVFGDNKEITITANTGYKLKSVKVDNVEQTLPLTNNKL